MDSVNIIPPSCFAEGRQPLTLLEEYESSQRIDHMCVLHVPCAASSSWAWSREGLGPPLSSLLAHGLLACLMSPCSGPLRCRGDTATAEGCPQAAG